MYMVWNGSGYDWLQSWAEVQADYGTATVLRVDLGFDPLGSTEAVTAYVDDFTLTVDGTATTYALEPIFLDAPYYEPGDTVTVTVSDAAANTHSAYIDTVEVTANNTAGDILEDIVLEETGVNSGIFTGSFQTTDVFPAPEGQLYVEDYEEFDAEGNVTSFVNDIITVIYEGAHATAAANNDRPEVTLDLPAELVNNAEAVEVPSTTTNLEYGLAYDPVIFVVTIDAPQALATDDVVLDPPLGGVEVVDGNLVGYWGPDVGFPMGAPYDETSPFTAKVVDGPLGTYIVTVDLLDLTFPEEGGATYGENEYHVLASVSDTTEVVAAEPLMVTVSEDVSVVLPDDSSTINVTIQGEDFGGPDGNGTEDINELDYVDIVVSGPNVSYSLAKAYYTGGTTWDLEGEASLPTGAAGVNATTITFEVAPNMANEDITVEVTGYTYADLTFTPVGPVVPKTVFVLGYALYNYPTDDVSVGQTASLALDVKTKDGNIVNSAIVTFSAGEVNALGKDFDESGEIEADEEFATIVFADNLITYGTGEEETYYINNGHYEVTDITFVDVANVSVDVRNAATPPVAAFVAPAFDIIGVDVYDVSLDPATVTASVATDVVVTVTEDGDPVTAIDSIKLDSGELLSASTSATGEYTISVPATPEAGTLAVMVTGEDGQKYGSSDLAVALPTVDYTIYETVGGEQVERNVMLATSPASEYTLDVTVNDALGVPLDGFLWIVGIYDEEEEEFTFVVDPATVTDGVVEDFDVTAPTEACSLVWMIGSSATLDETQALVPTPTIAVQSFSYDLNPTEATVGVNTTYTVTDNYTDPAADRDIKIVTPSIETVTRTTGPAGTPLAGKFMYNAAEVGDYYVSVKLDDDTWQAPITVTVSEPAVILDSIAASPESVTLDVDGTEELTVTATYSDETTADVTADSTYESSDPLVATVSEAGLITGVAVGDATVTVTYLTETNTVSVTVGFDPMVYDADGDGVISKSEALTAVADYFSGAITKAQALLVIVEYMG